MIQPRRLACLALPIGLAGCVAPFPKEAHVLAFPGAEGFGAGAMGGRGGVVCEVTNLDDSGPGSLRDCVDRTEPRTVVFRTGGTITLRSGLYIANPYITIAGQTAPGGGITLRGPFTSTGTYTKRCTGNGSNFALTHSRGHSITVDTHDVVIRFVRVRRGTSTDGTTDDGIHLPICGSGLRNVIVDHSSVSWGTDEDMEVATHNDSSVTVQWSIFAETLLPHSMTFNMFGGNLSLHHNLFAHGNRRNPQVAGGGYADVVNNVAYNYGNKATNAFTPDQRKPQVTCAQVNVVMNYYKAGPSTVDFPDHEVSLTRGPENPYVAPDYWSKYCGDAIRSVYVEGNIGPERPTEALPDSASVHPANRDHLAAVRFPEPPEVYTTSAEQAYEEVLRYAGAVVPQRDAVDQRILADVRTGMGTLIDDPSQVGGWPRLAAGRPPLDSDHDGMPDPWEAGHGLDPGDASDRNGDRDGDGYTNLEEYLNGLVAHTFPAGGGGSGREGGLVPSS